MSKPINRFASRTFQKIDANGDGQIDAKEVKQHLGRIGVGGGIFGIIHNKASDQFISTFDSSGDKKVSWAEFQGKVKTLLPGQLFDAKGRVDRSKANLYFQRTDANGDGQISIRELRKAVLQALPRNTSFKGTIADIAAKLGVNMLDASGDKTISRAEFEGALNAIDKHFKKA